MFLHMVCKRVLSMETMLLVLRNRFATFRVPSPAIPTQCGFYRLYQPILAAWNPHVRFSQKKIKEDLKSLALHAQPQPSDATDKSRCHKRAQRR